MASSVWKDPTVLATVLVVKAPLLLHALEHGLEAMLFAAFKYLLSPTMIASYIYLYLVVKVANMGTPVKLSHRDQRVAYWFLMNGTDAVHL
jgi:hypothetical protein